MPLLLVAMPGATSSVLAPSIDASYAFEMQRRSLDRWIVAFRLFVFGQHVLQYLSP